MEHTDIIHMQAVLRFVMLKHVVYLVTTIH